MTANLCCMARTLLIACSSLCGDIVASWDVHGRLRVDMPKMLFLVHRVMACCSLSLQRKKKKKSLSLLLLSPPLSINSPLSLPLASKVVIVFGVKWSKGKARPHPLRGCGSRPFSQHGHKTHRPWHIAGSLHARLATPSMHYYTG